MVLRWILTSLLFLFSAKSFAAGDLIVFISAAKSAPEVAKSDYTTLQRTMADFNSMVKETSLHLPEHERSAVIHLEIESLYEMTAELEKTITRNPHLEGLKIKMLYFAGHGNEKKFWLHDNAGYTGREVAQALVTREFHPYLAKDIGVYFSACNCGASTKPEGFQVQFMEDFKELNAAIEQGKQTRSLVSLAHRYLSTAGGFRQLSSMIDTVFYKAGVLSFIDGFDHFVFKHLGRTALQFSSVLTAGVYYGTMVALQSFVGPDAVGEHFRHLMQNAEFTSVAIFFGHSTLRMWSSAWARLIEYSRTEGIKPFVDLGSGNGVYQLIRMPVMSCRGVFL